LKTPCTIVPPIDHLPGYELDGLPDFAKSSNEPFPSPAFHRKPERRWLESEEADDNVDVDWIGPPFQRAFSDDLGQEVFSFLGESYLTLTREFIGFMNKGLGGECGHC
jgi:hypothetical protein